MSHLGYEEFKASGSRRKFIHPETGAMINLHEPHPDPTLKRYAINFIIEHLKEK